MSNDHDHRERLPVDDLDDRASVQLDHDDDGRTHYYGDGCDDDHGRAEHDDDHRRAAATPAALGELYCAADHLIEYVEHGAADFDEFFDRAARFVDNYRAAAVTVERHHRRAYNGRSSRPRLVVAGDPLT